MPEIVHFKCTEEPPLLFNYLLQIMYKKIYLDVIKYLEKEEWMLKKGKGLLSNTFTIASSERYVVHASAHIYLPRAPSCTYSFKIISRPSAYVSKNPDALQSYYPFHSKFWNNVCSNFQQQQDFSACIKTLPHFARSKRDN